MHKNVAGKYFLFFFILSDIRIAPLLWLGIIFFFVIGYFFKYHFEIDKKKITITLYNMYIVLLSVHNILDEEKAMLYNQTAQHSTAQHSTAQHSTAQHINTR